MFWSEEKKAPSENLIYSNFNPLILMDEILLKN